MKTTKKSKNSSSTSQVEVLPKNNILLKKTGPKKAKNKDNHHEDEIVIEHSPLSSKKLENKSQTENLDLEEDEEFDLESEDEKNTLPQLYEKQEIIPEQLPDAVLTDHELERINRKSKQDDPLSLYLQEIRKYPLLSLEEEHKLTHKFKETGDIEIAKVLVQSNLRLVVKIAMEYQRAFQNVLDLIQEGNVGLMRAVSKYDPEKGAKLSYYASWWIRSYILKFILDNFRLVKIGTTTEQKKLFYNLIKEKDRLLSMGIRPENKLLSENLGVSEKSVRIMQERMGPGSNDISLDKPIFDEGSTTLGDQIAYDGTPVDEILGQAQGLEILKDHLHDFMTGLKERDREIFEKRLLTEVPPSLQSIADEYGVSRERIRQVEERLLNKLKVYMSEFIR